MQITTQFRPLTDPQVNAHLAHAIENGRKVHMDRATAFRGQRSHVRLHRDTDGQYFIVRGSDCKEYLVSAKLTWLDGELTLVQFRI